MGISIFRNRSHQFKNIFRTISTLQNRCRNPKENPEVVRITRGVGLALLAVFFAWMSKTSSENSARELTLHSEWPQAQVWNSLLKQGGWVRTDHHDLADLLKNHPDPFTNESIIWESENHCFIYLSHSPYLVGDLSSTEAELWACTTGRTTPGNSIKWHKLGSGYAGINKLSQISLQTVKKATSYIDPKEIRY